MKRALAILTLLVLAACTTATAPTAPCWLDYGVGRVHIWVHYETCPNPLPPDAVRGSGP